MNKRLQILFLFIAGIIYLHASAQISGIHVPIRTAFIENKGQWDRNILYKADIPSGALFVEHNILTYSFFDQKSLNKLLDFKHLSLDDRKITSIPDDNIKCHSYKVKFEGSNKETSSEGHYLYTDYNNYYIGNDPARWTSRVRKFQDVTLHGLYKGIDFDIIQKDGNLKYNFYIEPGTDPSVIKMDYEGVDKLRLKEDELQITTSVNKIMEMKPYAWQKDAQGNTREIACRFVLRGSVVSFVFPEGFDNTRQLVIDPILVFSSFSGSTTDNWGYTATYDKFGFLYAGGNAFAMGYPTTTGSYQISYGGGSSDMCISKYDTTGTIMVFSTYLGGMATEVPTSMVVGNSNDLYVMGVTGSSDYPVTPGAYQQSFHGGSNYTLTYILHYPLGSDIVVSRFNQNGTALLASTFLGGNGNDGLNEIAPLKHNYADDARGEIKLDNDNNVYVVTSTQSTNLPVTPGAFQQNYGGVQDGCLFKLSANLSSLLICSYIGGSGADAAYSVVIDDDKNIYIAGGTASANFPVTGNAFQQSYMGGGCDGFILKLNPQGTTSLASTYYGSTLYDQVYFVDLDKAGFPYVLGQTNAGGNTFIYNASWSTPNGGQFISKFHKDLGSLVYSTAFGTGNGGPDISPTAFMVDFCNNIYVSGWGSPYLNGFGGTNGLPLSPGCFQNTTDNSDYYFLVMKGDASALLYGTYFGGSAEEHVDGGTSRFDKKGRIYQSVCAGCGATSSFPTYPPPGPGHAWSNTNNSNNCNNAVIKFDFKLPLTVAEFIPPPTGCVPYNVTFQNTSSSPAPSPHYYWTFGDGGTSSQKNPTHTYLASGVYIVKLVIIDTTACNHSDSISQQLLVMSNTASSLPAQQVCFGSSVQIGITPSSDPAISYSWVPASGLSSPNVANPFASPSVTTAYNLLVTNGSCTDTLHQTLTVINLKANAGNDTTICSTQLTLTAHANIHPVTWHWSSTRYFTDTLNSTLTDSTAMVNIQNQSTWFYVLVSDGTCTSIDSIHLSFSILISPAVGNNPSCPGGCDGSANVTVNGGSPPIQYLWSNGSTSSTMTGLCAGTYTVTVTDFANCKSVESIQVVDPPPFNPNPVVKDVPCTEICIGQITTSMAGGTPPYTYLWSNAQTTPGITDLCAGNYAVTITDDHGCQSNTSSTVNINSIFVNAVVSISPDSIFSGQQTQLHATHLPNCSYQWSPSFSLNNASDPDPVATPPSNTTYFLTITDQYGCKHYDSLKVFVKEVICREPYIYVPNAFTPNGDGKNDVIYIRGNIIEAFHLVIYDRWGELVYESSDQSHGWDGTFRGKMCEPGVYVYYLDARCYNKEVYNQKGNITLIR